VETKIYYQDDVNQDLLSNKLIAIIGYGAQGQAHALNLRDSGCQVVVGQRRDGPGFDAAKKHGFDPVSISQAAASADLVNLLLPDEVHGQVFKQQIRPHLSQGNIVMTCHGFSFHYGYVTTDPGIERLLVAPKGQGHMVRGEYIKGGGVPCLIATDEGASTETFQLGLAYAAAIGGTRAGVIQTTIAAETETDLFGEQAVLCGGVTSLVQAGFDTLVQAGYQPELAYFECLHELKIIVDLLHSQGIAAMREAISTTAEYGDYTRGPRVIDDHVRATMKQILAEIQGGQFARQFIEQHEAGDTELKKFRRDHADTEIERVGKKLRSMMPWLRNSRK
jgi:ketol-acid reductoisomerase